MITEAILGALMSIGEFVLDALPDASSIGLEGFAPAVSLALRLDAGLPVTEAVAGLVLLLTIATGVFVTRLALMVWHAIPGKLS